VSVRGLALTLGGAQRWLTAGLASLLLGALSACSKPSDAPTAPVVPTSPAPVFTVLAGSELREIEPKLMEAANKAGVALKLSYAGTLDIVERVNGGEAFDAVLPPNGAYPALALNAKPLAREKLFYSRVAIGVKAAKLKSLGWDKKNPSWADIAKAAEQGQLRYAMTNPTSSNTGMSALFAVASAVAGKTEDLTVKEVDSKIIQAFLSGQKLTAGSSGWLAEAYVKDPSVLDAMVNYEAVLLQTNTKLGDADKLSLVYPQDGVISADYPLMLLNGAKREDYNKLVAAFKSPDTQRAVAADAFLRPAVPDVPLGAGLSAAPVAELSFPNNLDVINAVLESYQGEWRRPATSIFVLDTSGSMAGVRIAAMREAIKVLAGADASTASARYARFQAREHVFLIQFSNEVREPVAVDFQTMPLTQARTKVIAFADGLQANGGTAIYGALLKAQTLAAKEMALDSNRVVSIVLLTDGENNVDPNFEGFKNMLNGTTPARVFPILFGEASPADMAALAQFTGGRVFDGRKARLAGLFKEIRGYQ
jgi:Ca-activated chloride channel homolog